jgi:Subtilase family
MRKMPVAALVAITAAIAPQTAHAARSPASDSLKRLVAARGGDARDAGAARYAFLRKLDGGLQDLAAGGAAPPRGQVRPLAPRTSGGRVRVDVYATGDLEAAARELRALGLRVAAISRRAPQRMIEGDLPVAALASAARLGRVRAVTAVAGTGTDTGSQASEGDAAHRGPAARALGATGAGVTVGVVSDSIDQVGGGVADSQASGDLPGDVQVLEDDPGSTDEGRAMAEIIYDEAPGVTKMLFHTGTIGAADRAAGVDQLVAGGARVIADDIFQIEEPFFQDGAVAQAIDRARAAGVAYFVSAGNRARQSWEGTFAAGPGDSEDFDPGPGTDTVQTLGTFSNRVPFISFQWDEPWGGATSDFALDIYTVSSTGTATFQFTADTDNIANGLPREFTQIDLRGITATIGIGIRRVTGTGTPFLKYIVGGTPAFTVAEHNNPGAGAINPDGASSDGGIAVAAVASDDAGLDTPESFSSRGPTQRRFDAAGNRLPAPDIRAKPDIAAADKITTTVPGFQPFFGTSAATPSAAGVATLVRSADPSLSVDDVEAILKLRGGNVDCSSAPGFPDFDCGFGFVFADNAVRAAQDSSPPAVTAALNPAAPTGQNGFYTGNVTVSWSESDGESPITSFSGCDPTTVTTDGTATLSCTATSAGGAGTGSVTVKRDASPPATPVVAGITAGTTTAGKLPQTAACTSNDPHSGVASCTVAGFSRATGSHTLTATAVNGAGLSSTSTLTYRVAAPTITKPKAKGRTISFTLSAPAKVTFTVARCAKKCKTVGKFSKQGKAGKNKAKLPKKVNGKKLKKGKYKVTLRAKGGKAKSVRLKLR